MTCSLRTIYGEGGGGNILANNRIDYYIMSLHKNIVIRTEGIKHLNIKFSYRKLSYRKHIRLTAFLFSFFYLQAKCYGHGHGDLVYQVKWSQKSIKQHPLEQVLKKNSHLSDESQLFIRTSIRTTPKHQKKHQKY